jgi:hypothetical protein
MQNQGKYINTKIGEIPYIVRLHYGEDKKNWAGPPEGVGIHCF